MLSSRINILLGTAVRQVEYSILALLSDRLKTELDSGTAFMQVKN
jgi:hypothetical protein